MIDTLAAVRTCTKCRILKNVSEFYPHNRDGCRPACKECEKAFKKGPSWKEYRRTYCKGYYDIPGNGKKQLARGVANRLLLQGHIKRQPCASCSSADSQMHHEDYGRPLLITWFCIDCHIALHNQRKTERSDDHAEGDMASQSQAGS